MQAKVAVILSGCGVYDGAEIQESVLTLLRLDQRGAQVQCFAPDMPQWQVINHLTGQPQSETRNVRVEAARIARGAVADLADLDVSEFDALILPGGFGVAKNLCNFAHGAVEFQVHPQVLAAGQAFAQAGKPVGLACIAPVLAASLFGPGVVCTIGADAGTAQAIESMGGQHQSCAVDDVVIDTERGLVTTPAYMCDASIAEVAKGITKLVDAVLERARPNA